MADVLIAVRRGKRFDELRTLLETAGHDVVGVRPSELPRLLRKLDAAGVAPDALVVDLDDVDRTAPMLQRLRLTGWSLPTVGFTSASIGRMLHHGTTVVFPHPATSGNLSAALTLLLTSTK